MKIVVIKKKERSSWRSCQSITSNLEVAYSNLGKVENFEVSFFGLSESSSFDDFHQLSQKIQNEEISHVAWIDHYPHPGQFLRYLKSQNLTRKPTFLFHLFGDFVLHSPMWKGVASALASDFKVKLICASYKQAELVKSLSEGEEGIDVIPFPVDDSFFHYNASLREEGRAELGVAPGEKVFLYTGRLSYQKNIIDLIKAFSLYLKLSNDKARLCFTGPMDDLGIPYIGKEALMGTFYFHWQECLSSLPPEHQSLIHYLGNVEQEKLKLFYCAADYYVSLSCHNDEDYGMSPAEALMCGLPCLLSAWGGFSSFQKYCPKGVRLVDVELNDSRQAPLLAKAAQGFLSLENGLKREDLAERAKEEISIPAVEKKIAKLLTEDEKYFSGFNAKFYKLSSQFISNPTSPFRSAKGGYNHFYLELYELYCGGLL